MQVLKEAGIHFETVVYLNNPPDEAQLRDLSKKLGLAPKDFIRKKESLFKELGLKDRLDDDDELFRQMAAHPKLIERPIIVKGNKALLGRPPEKVLEIL